jgi:hypothetical protein
MLTRDAAIAAHGKDGDGCWTDERQLCDKRRNNYKKRLERNTQRRVARALEKGSTPEPINEFQVEAPERAVIVLILYVDDPATFKLGETPIQALGAELWVGLSCKERMNPPISCLGYRADQVTRFLPQILAVCSRKFSMQYNAGQAFSNFAAMIPREIRTCPVATPFNLEPQEG